MKKAPASSLGAGAFLGFGGDAVAGLLISLTQMIPAVQQSQNDYMAQQEAIMAANPNFWIEVLYISIIAPFLEEFLCRGLMLNTLKKSMTASRAIIVSAVIFAFIHGNLYQIVFTLPLGILMAWLAHRFDSILPSFFCHVAFNFSNYPARICLELGFGEEDPITTFVYLALLLFCFFAIPLGVLLIRYAITKKAPPAPVFEAESATLKEKFNNYMFDISEGEDMAAPEYMIVGLGNPGKEYEGTRHNAGFAALDYISAKCGESVQKFKFDALVGEANIGGARVLLMKPQTFMNLSGRSVLQMSAYFNIPPQRIIVLFDDISLAPGRLRIRADGSAGGHNGIKSIISELGSQNFPRVKIGVGAKPEQETDLAQWVLSGFSASEEKALSGALKAAADAALCIIDHGIPEAANRFNGMTQ